MSADLSELPGRLCSRAGRSLRLFNPSIGITPTRLWRQGSLGPRARAGKPFARRYIEERYRLMPYLYTVVRRTLAHRIARHPAALPGISLCHKGFAALGSPRGNEFLFGPDLLVAPPPFRSNKKRMHSNYLRASGTTTGPEKKFSNRQHKTAQR